MIQVYTGNGKGKTTAALGSALRASGAGMRVYIAQFLKGQCYSELAALRKLKNVTVEQFGRACFITRVPGRRDKRLAQKGFLRVKEIIAAKKFGLVILDEVNVALKFGLIPLDELLKMLKCAPKKTEIILTGRGALKDIIKLADLVSEVKEVKHYYSRGIKARKGIEH